MAKIVFKQTIKSEFTDALSMMGAGFCKAAKLLGKLVNITVHEYPYAYIFVIITCGGLFSVTSLISARAERDAAVKRAYIYEQKLDSATTANDIRTEQSYVCND